MNFFVPVARFVLDLANRNKVRTLSWQSQRIPEVFILLLCVCVFLCVWINIKLILFHEFPLRMQKNKSKASRRSVAFYFIDNDVTAFIIAATVFLSLKQMM